MARIKGELSKEAFFIVPKRPEPVTLVAGVHVTDHLCMLMQHDRKIAENYVKRALAQQLLEGIMAKCLPFDVAEGLEDFVNGHRPLRMEVTVHDRGSYEHWLPVERREGWREGFVDGEKAVRRRLPHGIDIDRTEE